MFKRFRKNKKGFTLIELVVVVAILGVLALLVVPNVVNKVDEAREKVRETNAKLLQKALDMYLIDNPGGPPAPSNGQNYSDKTYLESILVPKYLDEIPDLQGISIEYNSQNGRFVVKTND